MLPLIISSIESPEDRDMMTDFYTLHCGVLHKEAWKYLNIKEDVEDVVYEALTKIIDKMEVFRDLQPSQRIQYALTTVRNLSYILLKRNNHFSFVSYDAVDFETLVDNHLPPEATVERKQAFEHLREVWNKLSIDDRMLLEQKYILCWNDADLACQLGIQPSSVRMRLTRTKRKLMNELKNQGVTLAEWE